MGPNDFIVQTIIVVGGGEETVAKHDEEIEQVYCRITETQKVMFLGFFNEMCFIGIEKLEH